MNKPQDPKKSTLQTNSMVLKYKKKLPQDSENENNFFYPWSFFTLTQKCTPKNLCKSKNSIKTIIKISTSQTEEKRKKNFYLKKISVTRNSRFYIFWKGFKDFRLFCGVTEHFLSQIYTKFTKKGFNPQLFLNK